MSIKDAVLATLVQMVVVLIVVAIGFGLIFACYKVFEFNPWLGSLLGFICIFIIMFVMNLYLE